MPFITTKDGTDIYYKDWGNKSGPTVLFSHGWPLNGDHWENQMFFLANQGYRVIAHDRRGHGRSSQPWEGNDMDTYADDLYQLFEHLDLKGVTVVGHGTGGGEVTRLVGRHGTGRVSKAVLISAVPPLLLKTDNNPKGVPMEVFDDLRSGLLKDKGHHLINVQSGPFYAGTKPSQGLLWSWWQQGMMCGIKNAHNGLKAFSETDFTEDLKKMDIPVLLLHGDDDQIVPIEASAYEAIKLLPKGKLKVYPGGVHQLPHTAVEEVNRDLLEFLKS